MCCKLQSTSRVESGMWIAQPFRPTAPASFLTRDTLTLRTPSTYSTSIALMALLLAIFKALLCRLPQIQVSAVRDSIAYNCFFWSASLWICFSFLASVTLKKDQGFIVLKWQIQLIILWKSIIQMRPNLSPPKSVKNIDCIGKKQISLNRRMSTQDNFQQSTVSSQATWSYHEKSIIQMRPNFISSESVKNIAWVGRTYSKLLIRKLL